MTLSRPGVGIRDDVALIGPIGAGKSTVAALLADALGVPRRSMDDLRSIYYAELGYDEAHADALRESKGMMELYRYWKPFEAHAVERVLAEHSGCVIDFGAGHSVFEDSRLFGRVQRALAGVRFVVLLLPSPDPETSIRSLLERLPPEIEGVAELNEHFVRHPSNSRLATHTIQRIANSGKLTTSLSNNAQTEILNIIRTDWPRLQNLADRYWNNQPVPVPVPQVPQQNTIPCSFPNCNGQVPLYIDPNTQKRQKAVCDTCYTYQ